MMSVLRVGAERSWFLLDIQAFKDIGVQYLEAIVNHCSETVCVLVLDMQNGTMTSLDDTIAFIGRSWRVPLWQTNYSRKYRAWSDGLSDGSQFEIQNGK
jgi:hypothetical protein